MQLVTSALTMGRTAAPQIDDPDINLHAILNQLRLWPWKPACHKSTVCTRSLSLPIAVLLCTFSGDVRSFIDTMASDGLYLRMNLFALLLLALSLLTAAKTVSQPGDWVAVPKVGVPNSWAVGDERIMDGDPLQKIDPEVRNKHRENVPVLRKVDGECDCAEPTMCRRDRLSPESVSTRRRLSGPRRGLTREQVAHCMAAHRLHCHRSNPACSP
jgi:hypothetical protein